MRESHREGVYLVKESGERRRPVLKLEFRHLFESAPDGILLLDARTGKILDVNRAFIEISGYSQPDLVGKNVQDVEPLRRLDEQFSIYKRLQNQDRIFIDEIPFHTRRRTLSIDLICNVLPVDGTRIIQCSLRDVSERKSIAEALRRSEEQFRFLFEDHPHPMWIFDRRSLAFLAVNDAAILAYGYSRQEFLSMTIKDLYLPEDLPEFLKNVRHSREALKPDIWKHRKKSGEIIEAEVTPHRITFNNADAVLIVSIDVTARKQAEQLSKETRQLLQDVLHALPVGVWIADPRGNIIMANPAGKRIWGGVKYVGPEQYDEYRGWWADTGKKIEAQEWPIARAVKKGEQSLNQIIKIEGFDGSRKTIQHSAVPLLDSREHIKGALVVTEDITERMRQEQELKRIHEILERQATTDTLVGIYNRLKFNELLEHEIRETARYKYPLSVQMFDIDHFKIINDTYGHLTGDAVLKEIVGVVSKNIRIVDMFARWGGEEFVILSPNIRLREAQVLAEKLRTLIERHQYKCNCRVTCSFGVTQFRDGDTVDSFIRRVDDALYKAKERGRNRVEVA